MKVLVMVSLALLPLLQTDIYTFKEVVKPSEPFSTDWAFAALKTCNGSVLSAVVSRTRRDGGEPSLYLRVLREEAREVERLLRTATMILLVPEHA